MKNIRLQTALSVLVFGVALYIFLSMFQILNLSEGETLRQSIRDSFGLTVLSLVLALMVMSAFFYATTRSKSQIEKDQILFEAFALNIESAKKARQILDDVDEFKLSSEVEKTAKLYSESITLILAQIRLNPTLEKSTELNQYAVDFAEGYHKYAEMDRFKDIDPNAKETMKLFEAKIPRFLEGMHNLAKGFSGADGLQSMIMALEMKMDARGR